MKINLKNETKISAALLTIQDRCSARTMCYHDIKSNLKGVETRLSELLGGISHWKGVKVEIGENFGKKPASYRGDPESTFITLEYCASGWFVTGYVRRYSKTNQQGDWQLSFTDTHKARAIDHITLNRLTED